MSRARSETGNTRSPRSTFKGTPRSSKKAIVSWAVKPWNALYKKRPFRGTLRMSPSTSQQLVTLHRPLPVMLIFVPQWRPFSSRSTWQPWPAAVAAAIMPAAPPPITTTRLICHSPSAGNGKARPPGAAGAPLFHRCARSGRPGCSAASAAERWSRPRRNRRTRRSNSHPPRRRCRMGPSLTVTMQASWAWA